MTLISLPGIVVEQNWPRLTARPSSCLFAALREARAFSVRHHTASAPDAGFRGRPRRLPDLSSARGLGAVGRLSSHR